MESKDANCKEISGEKFDMDLLNSNINTSNNNDQMIQFWLVKDRKNEEKTLKKIVYEVGLGDLKFEEIFD